MKRLLQLALVVTPLITAGCRQNPYVDSYIEILNAEKRMLEDRINDLEHDYEAKVAELEKCRSDVKRLESELDEPGGFRMNVPELPGGNERTPVPDLAPPNITPGVPVEPGNGDDDMPPMPPEELQPNGASSTSGSGGITHLFLNPLETRITTAQKDGQDGVAVTFEPRNDDERFVAQPGAVTVAVVDPASQARLARWDFDQHEVKAAIGRSRRSVTLRMPWPDEVPGRQRLELEVRFTTADGRDVRAEMPLGVPAEQLSAGWTPRPPRRRVADPDPVNVARQQEPPRTLSVPVELPARRAPAPDRPQWRPYR